MIMSNKTDNNLNTSINEMYKLIGGQIRKMRRITGVTSTELGNLIGVSQQQSPVTKSAAQKFHWKLF